MFVSNRIRVRHVLHTSWKSLLYFLSLSVGVCLLHYEFEINELTLPFNAIATFSTALAIYLGFKNNQAYDRWWEGRKIWGLLVNYSRAFAREVLTFPQSDDLAEQTEIEDWKRRTIMRHVAFVHGLRVFLRRPNGHVRPEQPLVRNSNDYNDLLPFLSADEYDDVVTRRNPPNQLQRLQGEALEEAHRRKWLTDYRFVAMSRTLSEFNNHQGKAERIKGTPLPRGYTIYSRIFVFLHGTMLPFAFIESLGWLNIPLTFSINFVFLSLDQLGHYTEDPFENRASDVPLTTISLTIEENLKEMLDRPDGEMPLKPKPVEGVIF